MAKNKQNDLAAVSKETLENALNGQYADKVNGRSLIKLNANVSKTKRSISVPVNWNFLLDAYVDYVLADQGVGKTDARRREYADEILVELIRLQIRGDRGFKEYLDAAAANMSADESSNVSQAAA